MCTPVSKFVLLRAYDKCRDKLTAAVTEVGAATQIGSLLDWAFELSQKDIIYSALNANLAAQEANLLKQAANSVAQGANSKAQTANGPIVVKGVRNSKLSFFPVAEADFDGSTITVKKGGNIVPGSVIWCLKANQGLFDAAFYFGKTLVTLQFTVALKHSLGLEHVRPIRTAIINKGGQVERVIHLGIVTKENERTFKFLKPTGDQRLITPAGSLANPGWSAGVGPVVPSESEEENVGNKRKRSKPIAGVTTRAAAAAAALASETRTASETRPASETPPPLTFIIAVDATSLLDEQYVRAGGNSVLPGTKTKFYEMRRS
jgi:hypothetical protein